MPDVTTIEYTDASGTRRKVEFVEKSLTDPPERREWERVGVGWRPVGSEPVSDLHID